MSWLEGINSGMDIHPKFSELVSSVATFGFMPSTKCFKEQFSFL